VLEHSGGQRHPTTRIVGRWAIGVVNVISLLALLGWALKAPLLKGISPLWTPMKLVTAACFLLLTTGLVLTRWNLDEALPQRTRMRYRVRRTLAWIFSLAVIVIALLTIVAYLIELVTGQNANASGIPLISAFLTPGARMALLTAITFVLAGLAVLLPATRGKRVADVAHAIAIPAGMISYLVPLSYLLGVQSMSSVLGTAVALNTGIAFCALVVAVFCARTDTWLMSALTSERMGGVMARRLLPGLFALPVIVGWLRLNAERHGIFRSDVGVAMVALIYSFCFVGLIWLAVRSINRGDLKQRQAEFAVRESERALRTLNSELEQRVAAQTAELRGANEALEQRVVERTAELRLANESLEKSNALLRDSRLAAINLTEDAVDERKRAEEVARELERSNQSLRASRLAALNLTEDAVAARRQAEKAGAELARSEEHFRALFETMAQGVVYHDATGRITSFNPAAERLLGLTRGDAETLGADTETPRHGDTEISASPRLRVSVSAVSASLHLPWAAIRADGSELPPEEHPAAVSLREGRTVRDVVIGVLNPNLERRRWVSVNAIPVFAPGAATPHEVYATYEDITERLSAERMVAQLARLYEVLSRVNESIVRSRDSTSLLQAACDAISTIGDYPLVWVGMIGADAETWRHGDTEIPASPRLRVSASRLVEKVAASGRGAAYLNEVRIETDGPLGMGPTGTSIREGRTVVNGDFATNSQTAPWRRQALKYGFGSSAAFPLSRRGQAIGSLTLYARDPEAFGAQQIGILEALATDLSYALQALEDEAQRLRSEQELALAHEELEVTAEELKHQNAELAIAEEDLRRTGDYLRNLIDHANAPIVVWDPQFRITEFNRAAERLSGRAAGDVKGRHLELLFPRDQRAAVLPLLTQTSAGERWESVEIPIRHVDGSVRTVLWNSATIFSEDGKTLIGTIAQGQDITLRKQAEAELEQHRRHLEELVAQRTTELRATNETLAEQAELLGLAREAILVRDASDRITYWNEGARRLYGWAADEAIGKVTHDLFATVFPASRDQVLAEMREQGYWQGDLTHTRRDGAKIIVESRWVAKRDAQGRVAAVMETDLDVTARRDTERRRELMSGLLRLFSEKADRPAYLNSVVAELRNWTGCDCVGIRVVERDGGAPFATSTGFSPEFLESEGRLMLNRDQCICTRLIAGRTEPQDRSMLTSDGSFYCGNTDRYLAGLSQPELARFRAVCMKAGFASIAVLPIRYREETLGAIHIADDRPDALSSYQVQVMESLTALIGEALHRFNVEVELTEHRDHLSDLVERATQELSDTNEQLRNEVTERRMTEERLRETRDYLDSLLNNANAPIVVWDPEFRITRFNRAFERLTGRDAAEVVGEGLDVLFPKERLEESRDLVRRASMGERLEVVEIPIQCKDGSVRVVLWNSATLLDADGRTAIATIAQGQDITERKQAEAQVQASLNEKELLLSEVHHRVKNNLQIISSLLNLRFRKVRDAETRAAFEDSQARIRSIALIHERLYRSQDFARVDFAAYASDLTRSLFRSLSVNPEQIRLRLEISSPALPLDTATPLGLMVNELITNSLKHAFPNGRPGEIVIGLKRDEAGNLVLSYGDDGIGLPSDFVIDRSPGLGMQLIALLAGQVNGKVEVSRVKGAEFRVTIPARGAETR
jgi:PAS domain S-box-containing protein